MDKAAYYAVLGLKPTATAADVEAAYLALSQHLEPKRVSPELRDWAMRQAVLVDEAYAALMADGDDGDEDEAVAAPAATRTAPRRNVAPRPAPRSQRRDEYEDVDPDDDFEDGDDDLDYEEEETRPARRQPAAARQPATPSRPPSAGAGRKPPAQQLRWQEHGRRRSGARPQQVAYSRERPIDNARVRMLVLGLGVGIVIIGLAFLAMQAGLIGGKSQVAQQSAFDQARYNQLQETLNSDPNNYSVLFELGEMSIDANRFEDTIYWFKRVLEVRPNDVHAMQDIGTANFNLGDIDQAREMWLKALQVDPNDAQTRWNLGFLYASLTPPDIDAAMREWERVIALTPGTELARLSQSHIDTYKNRFPATPSSPSASPTPP